MDVQVHADIAMENGYGGWIWRVDMEDDASGELGQCYVLSDG